MTDIPELDNLTASRRLLAEAKETYLRSSHIVPASEAVGLSTAHGILALIELIQNNLVGDEEATDFDPTTLDGDDQTQPWHIVKINQQRDLIANLETQLDGARAVARNHEKTIETQQHIIGRCVNLATKWCGDNGGTLQAYGKKVHEAITGIPTNG